MVSTFDEASPRGRSRPEAQEYCKRGQMGTVSNLLQLQGNKIYFTSPSKVKLKTNPVGGYEYSGPDHLSANLRRIRLIQKATRKKQAELEQNRPKPVKALWKSEKYADVPSKVKIELQTEPPPPRPQSANFLRAHSRCGVNTPGRSRSPVVDMKSRCQTPSQSKPEVPRAHSALDVRLEQKNIDYVKLNGRHAKYAQHKRSPSATSLVEVQQKKEDQLKSYQRGQVPQYLKDRKKRWRAEKEERIRSMPDPDQPPGHRKLEEDERLNTLTILKASQAELLAELGHLPLRSDTLRIRTKREELESKLSQTEEAIKIFSRAKVFVKCD